MTEWILAKRVRATPERIALIDGNTGEEWSYRELSHAVERTAAALKTDSQQNERQTRVGTLLSPSPAFVIAFHAIRRLGWTLVGLERTQSTAELQARVAQTEPSLLLCDAETEPQAAKLTTSSCTVVPVSELDSFRKPQSIDHSESEFTHSLRTAKSTHESESSTALILFTSGTTGEPKAVRLTERNLSASAEAAAYRLGVSPDDRWLDCLPVAHMGGIAPVVRTTQYGTTLVVQREFTARQTAEFIQKYDVRGISLVPTQLRRLLDEDTAALSTLKTVLLGGAPAPKELLTRAYEGNIPVYPTYGLTETASQVATARPSQARTFPGTVGQPLYGTAVTIVNDGEPVGPEDRGELVVSGPTVTPGYLDGEKTTESFSEYGFHTGDVGYRDSDGRLFITGRLDDLIQTGGELVAPNAVVSTLESHPQVAEATVVGVRDSEWGERVCAVVVPDNPETVTGEEIRSFCRDRLAAYEVPKTVVVAPAIPRTVSGTVDRTAVRELVHEAEK